MDKFGFTEEVSRTDTDTSQSAWALLETPEPVSPLMTWMLTNICGGGCDIYIQDGEIHETDFRTGSDPIAQKRYAEETGAEFLACYYIQGSHNNPKIAVRWNYHEDTEKFDGWIVAYGCNEC